MRSECGFNSKVSVVKLRRVLLKKKKKFNGHIAAKRKKNIISRKKNNNIGIEDLSGQKNIWYGMMESGKMYESYIPNQVNMLEK